MTIEDYQDNFKRTTVNFDISDGSWYGDHYLFLNDEDRRNAPKWLIEYDNMTRHTFTLTNTATVAQKVYATVHTWDNRAYPNDDNCEFDYRAGFINFNGQAKTIYPGSNQRIFEMQPGETFNGWVDFTWYDDSARDWSITTWAQSGKVEVKLTSMPDRPSD